jgi:hypothetical protein
VPIAKNLHARFGHTQRRQPQSPQYTSREIVRCKWKSSSSRSPPQRGHYWGRSRTNELAGHMQSSCMYTTSRQRPCPGSAWSTSSPAGSPATAFPLISACPDQSDFQTYHISIQRPFPLGRSQSTSLWWGRRGQDSMVGKIGIPDGYWSLLAVVRTTPYHFRFIWLISSRSYVGFRFYKKNSTLIVYS